MGMKYWSGRAISSPYRFSPSRIFISSKLDTVRCAQALGMPIVSRNATMPHVFIALWFIVRMLFCFLCFYNTFIIVQNARAL